MTDKRLVRNLVGLNAASVRQVEFALQMCRGDHKLSNLYKNTLKLVETLVALVSREIASCRSDLMYWETMTHSTKIEVDILKWHVYAYRYMRHLWTKHLQEFSLDCMDPALLRQRMVSFATKVRSFVYPDALRPANTNDENVPIINASILTTPQRTSPGRSGKNIQETCRDIDKDVYGNIDEHIFVLRFDLQQMFCMMASIKEAAEHMKRIYTEIAVTSQRTVATRSKRQSIWLEPQMSDQLYKFACQNISYCLRDLLNTLYIYDVSGTDLYENTNNKLLDRLQEVVALIYKASSLELLSDDPPLALKQDLQSFHDGAREGLLEEEFMFAGQSLNTLDSRGCRPNISINTARATNHTVLDSLSTVYEDVNNRLSALALVSGGYPLQMTEITARRPSRLERLWLRDTAIAAAAVYSLMKLYGMHQSGYLKELVHRASISMAENVTQHLVEPLHALSQYLYQKIGKNEEVIVTRRELRGSRRDLKEMLDSTLKQISESSKGYEIFTSKSPNQTAKSADKTLTGKPSAKTAKTSSKHLEKSTTKATEKAPENVLPEKLPSSADVGLVEQVPADLSSAKGFDQSKHVTGSSEGYIEWMARSLQDIADYAKEKVEYLVPSTEKSKPLEVTNYPEKPPVKSGSDSNALVLDQSLEAAPFDPNKKVLQSGTEDPAVLAEISKRRAAGAPPRASMEVDNISDE